MTRQIFSGAQVFAGGQMRSGVVVVVEDGRIMAIRPDDPGLTGARVRLQGGILAPGLIDLQVNGGGAEMVGPDTDIAALRRICAVHLRLGSAGILPTLITDSPAVTARVIAAGVAAARAGVPGFLGLHLEGPHLDPARCGAHDPALIRPMAPDDLAALCEAAAQLPALMVTVAPAAVTDAQISVLTRAGVIVSLGHSDCSFATARAAMAAGASCVTHLFNAMSPLGSREPGLVGAALDGDGAAGLIADGIHVSPATLRIACAAKPRGLFLVSDCMAFAGSDLREAVLNGRVVRRAGGRLTMADATLAGADLTLPQALRVMVTEVGLPAERALAMATSVPAAVIGMGDRVGHLAVGRTADLVHLDAAWQLAGVWRAGVWQAAV